MGGPGPTDGLDGAGPGAPATGTPGTEARLRRAPPFRPVLKKYPGQALKARVDVLAGHLSKHRKYQMWKSTVAVLEGRVNGVVVRVVATMDVGIYEALRARAPELLEVGEILAPPPILVDVLKAGKKQAEVKAGTIPIHAEQHAVVYAKSIGITDATVATNFDGCDTCREFMRDHPDVRHVNLKHDRLQVEKRLRDAKNGYVAAERNLLRAHARVDGGKATVARLQRELDEELAKTSQATGKPEPRAVRISRERLDKATKALVAAESGLAAAEDAMSRASLERYDLEEQVARQRSGDQAQYRQAHDASSAAAEARMQRHSAHLIAGEKHAAAQRKADALRKRQTGKAETLRKKLAKADAARRNREAKAAAKSARPSPASAAPVGTTTPAPEGKGITRLRAELADIGNQLREAEQELERARAAMAAAAEADPRAVARPATGSAAAQTAGTGLPAASSSAPLALAEDARGLGPGSRGLEAGNRGGLATSAERGGQALPGAGLIRNAAAAGKLAKAWRITKILGGVAIGFFVPLSRLDVLFESALRLFQWDRERRARDAREWAEILAFLCAEQKVHVDRIGVRYATAAGTLIWSELNRRLADPQDPQRITTWIDRWERQPKWVGFVYARYRGGLMRQALSQEDEDEPYPRRYFVYGERSYEFSTLGLASNNEKKVLSSRTLRYNQSGNLFTAGTVLDQKERDPNLDTGTPSFMAEPNHDIYIHRDVDAVEFRIAAVLPTPLLTPFDYVIFKCNVLIIEIIQFISRFDENFFPTEYRFQEVGGIAVVNHLEDVSFPEPVNSANAHFCLKSLYAMVSDFRRHTHFSDGASLDEMAMARLKLARKWVPANEKGGFYSHLRPVREITRHLYHLTPHAQIDPYVRNRDPELAHIDETYLSECADRIEKDVVRMIGDMLSPTDGRRLLYRYNGAVEP